MTSPQHLRTGAGSRSLPINGVTERVILAAIAGVCILAALLLSYWVLQDSILSADEWSYLVQANIFSEGRLSVPSPPHREFFDHVHIVNNGRYYSKFPPGWPAVLAAGAIAGLPRLVNPLLGAGTLLLLYAIGRRVYDPRVGIGAALCALASPFFMFNTASYFSHTANLFFVSLMIYLLIRGHDVHKSSYFFFAGISGSISLLVRPFDQFVVMIPVGILLLDSLVRRAATIREFAAFAIGHAHGFAIFLLYNALQNGHPFQTGYHVADSWMDRWFDPSLPMLAYNIAYLHDLLTWSFPLLPLLMIAALFIPGDRAVKRWELCFAGILLALVLSYGLIAFHEGPSYGPRYYYCGIPAISLLGAKALDALSRKLPRTVFVPALLILIALSVGGEWPYYVRSVSQTIHAQNDLRRQVERIGSEPALVFLTPNPESGQAPTRNAIDFQGDVVFALDLGPENERLMDAYPGRRYFLYQPDPRTGQAALREIGVGDE